jgi:hypothetical protein
MLRIPIGDGEAAWLLLVSSFEDQTPSRQRLVDMECAQVKQAPGQTLESHVATLLKLNRRRRLCGLPEWDDKRLSLLLSTTLLPVYDAKIDALPVSVLSMFDTLRSTLRAHELTLTSRGTLANPSKGADDGSASAKALLAGAAGLSGAKQGPCWICQGPHQRKDCPKRNDQSRQAPQAGRGGGRGSGTKGRGGKGKDKQPAASDNSKTKLGAKTCWTCGSAEHGMKTCPFFLDAQARARMSMQPTHVQSIIPQMGALMTTPTAPPVFSLPGSQQMGASTAVAPYMFPSGPRMFPVGAVTFNVVSPGVVNVPR